MPEAEPVALESQVREVQVFRSGAVVVRAAQASAELVAFVGLPLAIDDESVRVSVVGEGKPLPRPADVRAEVVLPALGELPQPPSEADLRAARQKADDLRARITRLDTEGQWVDTIGLGLPQGKREEAPPAIPVAAWTGLIAWSAEAKGKRAADRRAAEDELRAVLEEITRMERREVEARARRDARADAVSKRVVVRLRGERPQGKPVQLRLEYRVPGARWVPTYVLRLSRDGRSAELGVRAHVVQASGEPWERVRLWLSTADLRRETELPELSSLRIGRRQPAPLKRAWREPPTGVDALFEGLDRALASSATPIIAVPDDDELLDPDEALDLLEGAVRGIPADADPFAAPFAGGAPRQAYAADPFGPPSGADLFDSGAAPALGAAPPSPPPPRAPGASARGGAPATGAFAAPRMAPMPASAPMPARSAAPPPQSRSSAKKSKMVSGSDDDLRLAREGGGGGSPLADRIALSFGGEPTAELVPESGLLRYGDLAMPRWDDRGHARARLRPVTWSDRLEGLDQAQRRTVVARLKEAGHRARGAANVALPAGTRAVEESCGAFDHRYDAEGLVDVPSDGLLHNVPLMAARTPVRTTLVVVPREGDQAVRVASLSNPLEAPLLAGPAEVYLEDEFLVTTPLRTVPAGGELVLGLGVEPALKVARNTFFDEEATGLLGGGLSLRHRLEVNLASRLAEPVDVEVRERVPVPADDEKGVEVGDESASPAWEKHQLQADGTECEGGRRWRLTLKPGEEKKLVATYVVKLDSKNELVGGNRRD